MEDNNHLPIGYYPSFERDMKAKEIRAKNIEIIHFSLTEDTCEFELIATTLEVFDRSIHEDQWRTLVNELWPLGRTLVASLTNWSKSQIIASRFRIQEGGGSQIKCHFHGFAIAGIPWNNIQIYVHTHWTDSLRRLEYDFIDISFIIEQDRDLANNELLTRRVELMDNLAGSKSIFEDFLTNTVKFMLQDATLSVVLQPIEVESDYDHECYSWSFIMKGIIK